MLTIEEREFNASVKNSLRSIDKNLGALVECIRELSAEFKAMKEVAKVVEKEGKDA